MSVRKVFITSKCFLITNFSQLAIESPRADLEREKEKKEIIHLQVTHNKQDRE